MSKKTEDGLLEKTAKYWAAENAKFEKTDPSLIARIGRSINPLTGFGSAMGDMHTSSGEGDGVGMALAALGAVPAFGAMRVVSTPAKGLIKASTSVVPDLGKTTGKVLAGGTLVGTTEAVRAGSTRAYNQDTDQAEVPDSLRSMQDGPDVPLDSALQFEQRVLYPSQYPVMEQEGGGVATHKMSWGEVDMDGKPGYVAFPTVVYDGKELKELDARAAFEHAMKNKEYRSFASPEEASLYAEGLYKRAWGRGDAFDALKAKVKGK